MRIGTRGSPLALAQSHAVRRALASAHECDEARFELAVIRTTGDAIQDRSLADAGGKGLFTKEIDAALLRGDIDGAVHSAKDLPTFLEKGVVIAGYPPREDVRDAFISAKARSIADLPNGAVFGTASPRRQAQVLRLRPDLAVVLLRGNVETRLHRTEAGEVDATILALAGMKRLGLADRATAILSAEDFLPAVGQGAIAVTIRAGDAKTASILTPIVDADAGAALAAERAFLAALEGSCRTPIAGHARIVDGRVYFRGMALRPDGSETFDVAMSDAVGGAQSLGERAGRDLLVRLPPGLLS